MPWRAAACDRARLGVSGAQGHYGARGAATRARRSEPCWRSCGLRLAPDTRRGSAPSWPIAGPGPTCIDYAAWPAIGGDHWSGPRHLQRARHAVILDVARISARLKRRLAGATRRDQRINAVRDSDIALQRADLDYATRPLEDVHFCSRGRT